MASSVPWIRAARSKTIVALVMIQIISPGKLAVPLTECDALQHLHITGKERSEAAAVFIKMNPARQSPPPKRYCQTTPKASYSLPVRLYAPLLADSLTDWLRFTGNVRVAP